MGKRAAQNNADAFRKEGEREPQGLDEDLKFSKFESVWMLDVCLISIAFLTQNLLMLPKKQPSWALLEADSQIHSLKAEIAIFRNSLRRLQACLNREQNRVLASLNPVKDCRRASYEMVRHCTKLTLLLPLACHCLETQEKRTNS